MLAKRQNLCCYEYTLYNMSRTKSHSRACGRGSNTRGKSLATDVMNPAISSREKKRSVKESLRTLQFIALKILSAVPMLIGVITVNFILVHLAPGDPVSILVGESEPTE